MSRTRDFPALQANRAFCRPPSRAAKRASDRTQAVRGATSSLKHTPCRGFGLPQYGRRHPIEVEETVVKRENNGPRGQGATMKTFNSLAERQNVASGLPQRLQSSAQEVDRYVEVGIPPVFVIQRNTVVTKDCKAIAPPTAIGYRSEIPGFLCRPIDR